MSFVDYWDRLKIKNSGLANDDTKVTLTVASLRSVVEQAFNTGKQSVEEAERQASLFVSIFGSDLNRKR